MAEYIQVRGFGTVFRKEGDKYACYNPWKGKWESISREDGTEEFHDYDNNRTSCTGSNIEEVIRAQTEYCVKHKGDEFKFSEFSCISLD